MDVGDGAMLVDYIPASALDDAERFKWREKLYITCTSCRATHSFIGSEVCLLLVWRKCAHEH